MNNNTESHNGPALASIQKLVGLNALALKMGIPDSDVPLLAIIIVQAAEMTGVPFYEICVGMVDNDEGYRCILKCMEPMREPNSKLTSEMLKTVFADGSSESTTTET